MKTKHVVVAGWRRLGVFLAVACLVASATMATVRAQEGDDGTPTLEFLPEQTVVPAGELTETRSYLVAEDDERTEITPILTSGEVVDDYQLAGTPDGLGLVGEDDEATLFVTHRWRSEGDEHLSDARVSRLELDPDNAAVLSGSYPIDGSEGYWDLSSGSVAGSDAGFDSPLFLAGEASTESDQGGVALALGEGDDESGDVTKLPWFGFLAHENQVAVPGFDGVVVAIADGDGDGSELYLYVAEDAEEVRNGDGQLYVFAAGDGAGPGDLEDEEELSGRFVPIEREQNDNATSLQRAADAAGAFAFASLGDVTYDRSDPNTLYLSDTGATDDSETASDGTPEGETDGGNGRLYRLELDRDDPTGEASLSVLLDGDSDDVRNPDGIDANDDTLLIQENLSAANREAGSEETARILAYDIEDDELSVVARVDQSDDPDLLVAPDDVAGSWASTGVVNAEEVYGDGAWLVAVQARTLEVAQFDGVDEGGQLLLLRVDEDDATPVASTPRPAPTAPPAATVAPAATQVPPTATAEPTEAPTEEPTAEPTATEEPTAEPTATEEPPTPTEEPEPTATDAPEPTATEETPPTAEPTAEGQDEV